jgi:hypothetical protein
MIIGISGYAGSGKDTVGEIIRQMDSSWVIKKWAGKLKTIASILTGLPVHLFEDGEAKNTYLGSEWSTLRHNPLNSITPFENIDFVEMMSVRELLQRLGTDAIRNGLHPNAWVNALMCDYRSEKFSGYIGDTRQDKDASKWIITDTRFPNEAKAIKDRGGFVIRVDRPGLEPINSHPSETALDKWDFDYRIDNSGTIEDLNVKVGVMIKTLIK